MVHQSPKNQLRLCAAAMADDLGFVALRDLSQILATLAGHKGLVIGGYMVTLHALRWGLDLFRETRDTDLGVPQLTVKNTDLLEQLGTLGYERIRSNRFAKRASDLPAGGENTHWVSIIDVLVPSLTSRARKNVKVGDLTTIEVPGLAEALNRKPVDLELELTRLNGDSLPARVSIPDERSALILKTFAWEARAKDHDAVDIWRCLESANAAGLTCLDMQSDDGQRAMSILHAAFRSPSGGAMRAIARARSMNDTEAKQRFTRIVALREQLVA